MPFASIDYVDRVVVDHRGTCAAGYQRCVQHRATDARDDRRLSSKKWCIGDPLTVDRIERRQLGDAVKNDRRAGKFNQSADENVVAATTVERIAAGRTDDHVGLVDRFDKGINGRVGNINRIDAAINGLRITLDWPASGEVVIKALAGITIKPDAKLDGLDLTPYLIGKNADAPHKLSFGVTLPARQSMATPFATAT